MIKKHKERWKRMVKGSKVKKFIRMVKDKEQEIRIAVAVFASPHCKHCQEKHCLACDYMREVCRCQ
jgi:hypothetical protein